MAAVTKVPPLNPMGIKAKAVTTDVAVKTTPGLFWGVVCTDGAIALVDSASASGDKIGLAQCEINTGITGHTLMLTKPVPFSTALYADVTGTTNAIVYYE
ncbi:MAG: hypothetical protein CMI54_00685 [Parcubacteria group bacterium]|jgi:hypothetical protein|nr:hypothetical protein [Parcubacteria group bacterium]|tara:strand:- start:1192 stop:1491 length:300 start_codon:yes stop_codon:yes gene_type:complete